jgi:hypothetical protein
LPTGVHTTGGGVKPNVGGVGTNRIGDCVKMIGAGCGNGTGTVRIKIGGFVKMMGGGSGLNGGGT